MMSDTAFFALMAFLLVVGAVIGFVVATLIGAGGAETESTSWLMAPPAADDRPAPPRWRVLLADPTAQRAIVRILAAGIGFWVKWAYARDIPAEHLEPALLAVIQGVNTLFDLLLGTMATTGLIGLRRVSR